MQSQLPTGPLLPGEIAVDLGLISDTHMPQRWPALPAALAEIFAGVEIILHAGDVGDLWVLDELSQIAPVIAVHGNDETIAAQTHLPFQQLLAVGPYRILLWHSHYSDREVEMRVRRIDTWDRILAHNTARAHDAGAQLVVMGHLHVPFFTCYEGIWIVNPGAIASATYLTRQSPQTVARLKIPRHGGLPEVTHYVSTAPAHSYQPAIAWEMPFSNSQAQFNVSIVEPGAHDAAMELARRLYVRAPEAFEALVVPLAQRCWSGEKDEITASDLLTGIECCDGIEPSDRLHFTRLLEPLIG